MGRKNTVAEEKDQGGRPIKATPDQVERLMALWQNLHTKSKLLSLPDDFQSLRKEAVAAKIEMKRRQTNKILQECQNIVDFLALTEPEVADRAKSMGFSAIENLIDSLEEAYDEEGLGGCFEALENARRELAHSIRMGTAAMSKRHGSWHPWGALHMANPYGHRNSHHGGGKN